MSRVLVGTPNFVAPEIIDGFYEGNNNSNGNDHKILFDLIKKGSNPIIQNGLGGWFPSDVRK